MSACATTRFSNNLYLITLPPPVPGFNNFISVWVYKGPVSFVVDVGPSVAAGDLIQALEHLDVNQLDYIFLTHIHLDHSGGIGDIAEHFSFPPIVCHPAAIPHLVNPEKLVAGTIKTLGERGKAYGPVKPVPMHRLVASDSFDAEDILIIPTFGHSPHHVSIKKGDHLFAGEAGGVYIKMDSDTYYMRPATPPVFYPEITIESIDRLISAKPEYICYGHYGRAGNATEKLGKHRNQILLWKGIINDEMDEHSEADREENILSRLVSEDPLLGGFFQMEESVRERERFFLLNSIRGFLDSLSPA